MATATQEVTELREQVEVDGRIDRAAGIIRNVKLISKFSKNDREYSDQALDSFVVLCVNRPVMFEHKKNEDGTAAPRQVREIVGWIANPRRQADSVYGDFHVVKSHSLADFLFEIAERNSTLAGFSQTARGKVRYLDNGAEFVEELVEVVSLDLVSDPATTQGLFESFDKQKREAVMSKRKTIREFVAGLKKTTPGRKTLWEMVEAPAFDGEVDTEKLEEMDESDQAKEALRSAINELIDNGATVDDIVASILAMLTPVQESEKDDTEGETVTEADGEEAAGGDESATDEPEEEESAAEGDSTMTESLAREFRAELRKLKSKVQDLESRNRTLTEENARSKAEASVRQMFESRGVHPEAKHIGIAAAMPAAQRGEYVDSIAEIYESRAFAGSVPRSSGGGSGDPATKLMSEDELFAKASGG